MTTTATNPEVDADLTARVEAFNAELVLLLKKHEVGLGGLAFITPDGRIGARPTVFNDRQPEVPPPTTPEEGPAEKAAPSMTEA